MPDGIVEIIEWLEEKNKTDIKILITTDLIEEKIIDSISFVEYVMMIEEVSGMEVVVDDEILDKVRTLEKVQKYFFEEQTA